MTLPNNGGEVTFQYDSFGRRIQKSSAAGTTIYVYDGANIVGEYDAAGTLIAKYAQGTGIDEPLAMWRGGQVGYHNADGLGSVTSIIDSTLTPLVTYSYDAFGKKLTTGESLTNPFQYTGREWDSETGLYYYRARYYDPNTGRFVSEDPDGFKDGLNVYRYVRNNPSLYVDPLGLCSTFRIKLWSTDEVTVETPRSPWVLAFHRIENAGDAVPINILTCHWTREYNTWIQTTTTYLVYEVCEGAEGCVYRPKERFYVEKARSWRTGTTTKTSNSGSTFLPAGFDSDTLEEIFCHMYPPSP